MGLLYALGFVYGTVYRIELALENRLVLGPHAMDYLAGLPEHPHPFWYLGEAVAVGAPLVLVPASAQAEEEPSVAHHVYRRGDLSQKRRVAVAVAGDHLPYLYSLGIAAEAGGGRPALEDRVHRRLRNGVEVVVDPDRVVPAALLGDLRHPGHRLVLLDGIFYLDKIHPPTLWNEHTELNRHTKPPGEPPFASHHNPGTSRGAGNWN